MKRLLTLTAATAALAFAFGAGQARAATLVVNDPVDADATEPAPCDATADHDTIQAAITAASAGDDIVVCPGTYTEDLEISGKDNLTIAAVDRTDKTLTVIEGVAVSTSTFPDCGVAAGVAGTDLANINIAANRTTITGFTIQSPVVANSEEYTCGLIFDGVDTKIYHNLFLVSSGDPGSVAIQTWALANGPIGDISGSHIVANKFRSSATAVGPQLGYEAIFISDQTIAVGADPVAIVHNDFGGDMYRAVATARARTDIKANTIATKIKIVANTTDFGTVPLAIRVFGPNFGTGALNCKVLDNVINSSGKKGQFDKGIKVSAGAQDCVFDGNRIHGSATFDCQDEGEGGTGTLGTHNLWQNNRAKTDDPDGICPQRGPRDGGD